MSIDTTSTPVTDPFEDEFSDPTTGFDKLQDYKGELVIIMPKEYLQGLTTKHSKVPGDTDAVDADFWVVTGSSAGKEVDLARVFSGGLVSQLRRSLGKKVLGRIGSQDFSKGPGWVINPATDADKVLARQYLADRTTRKAAQKASEDPFA